MKSPWRMVRVFTFCEVAIFARDSNRDDNAMDTTDIVPRRQGEQQ